MTAVKKGLTEERGEAGAAAPIDELPPEVRALTRASPILGLRDYASLATIHDRSTVADPARPPVPQVLYHIMSFLPRSAGTANALVGVCKGWREAILTDDAYLGSLTFSLVASQPFKGMETVRGAVAHRRTWAYADRHARAIDGAASTTTTKPTGGFGAGRRRRDGSGAPSQSRGCRLQRNRARDARRVVRGARGRRGGVQVLEEGGEFRIVSRAV